jgi:hypothetical protein
MPPRPLPAGIAEVLIIRVGVRVRVRVRVRARPLPPGTAKY